MEKKMRRKQQMISGSAVTYLFWVFIFFLSFPAAGLAGNQELERKLTVQEAIRVALDENHEVRAQRNARDARQKDVGIARSYLLPRVSVEERYLRTTNPGWAFMSKLNQERITQQDFAPDLLNHPDAVNDYQSSLTVEQPLFIKKAFVGLAMSKTEAVAMDEEWKRKREEIAFQVVRAAFMISSARRYVLAVAAGVADAREHLRVAELRYKNGLGQYADVLRASTALTEARQRQTVAEKNVILAKRGMGLLLASGEPVDVDDGTVAVLPLHEISIYIKAAESRSDLKAAVLREENARQNIKMAEAGYYPYVGVGGTYQLNDHSEPFGSEGKNWQVMAFLRWDLFDGTKREYERAKANHLASQASEQVAAMKKGVAFRIHEAYLNVIEARQNTELTREALKTAIEGARLLAVRYKNGLSSLADLLSSQASLEQARAGVVERENAYNIAVATLSYESGIILQDLKIEENSERMGIR